MSASRHPAGRTGLRCQASPPYDWTPFEVDPRHGINEQGGTKEKFWFDENRWLFKFSRPDSGEHWAECLTHVVAQLLGIPSACTALATCDGKPGVAIRNLTQPTVETDSECANNTGVLFHGNELLADKAEGFGSSFTPAYTPASIHSALDGYLSPSPYPWTAFDLMAGYLMMDALLAARDRHGENWAVLRFADGTQRLAPSFDHGNALGFGEREDSAQALLDDESKFIRWLDRGTSQHFTGNQSLVMIAAEALSLASTPAREYFRARLCDLCLDDVEDATKRMPKDILSVPHRRFILKILEFNRRRLLDAIHH